MPHTVDCFCLSQNYFKLPCQTIRKNANFICLLPQDLKNISHICYRKSTLVLMHVESDESELAVSLWKKLTQFLPHPSTSSAMLRLQSATCFDLVISSTVTNFGTNLLFAVAGLRAWNQLLSHIRAIQSVSSFKTALKTYLFPSTNSQRPDTPRPCNGFTVLRRVRNCQCYYCCYYHYAVAWWHWTNISRIYCTIWHLCNTLTLSSEGGVTLWLGPACMPVPWWFWWADNHPIRSTAWTVFWSLLWEDMDTPGTALEDWPVEQQGPK